MISFPTPATETKLISLAEIKQDLGIIDTASDVKLGDLIKAATTRIQNICGRVNFGSATVLETIYDRPGHCRPIWLKHWLVTAINSVSEGGTVLSAAEYQIEDGRKLWRMNGSHRISWGYGPVVVNYAGGYNLPTSCPDDLKRICANLIREVWFSLQRDPLVKSEEIPGVMSQSYWIGDIAGRSGGLSDSDYAVLANYTNHSFG